MAINNEQITDNNLKSITASLIYDRTQADADYALSLEQNSIYTNEDLKGAYNCSDRNRVGGAINYLTDNMKLLGFRVKDNWVETDIAKTTDNANSLACLNRLRQLLSYGSYGITAALPADLDSLTYQKANDIERVLCEVGGAFLWISDAAMYAGDGYVSDFDAFNQQVFDM